MRKTLLLCFIHGFKGGDDTFGSFPEHLRALVSHALPKVDVVAVQYPKFETRGDLHECVGRFREWLQNRVIDMEVAASTPSPTVDPGVHTILVGHSMGGIVAAETLLAIAGEKTISESDEAGTFMFPYIQGVLAFDTPYLGISPGVVAHGAEGHYRTAASTYEQLSSLAGVIWTGKEAVESAASKLRGNKESGASKEAAATSGAAAVSATGEAANAPAWQRWGRVAMYAGAGAAVAAGGAAAYLKREQLSEGWNWISSHLEFVGCLMRGEELRKRVVSVVQLSQEHGLGFANLYTCLGAAAAAKKTTGSTILGSERTFCALPKSDVKQYFHKAVNDQATDETWAHMSMFYPKENPGFYALGDMAKDLVVQWSTNGWYQSSDVDEATKTHEEL